MELVVTKAKDGSFVIYRTETAVEHATEVAHGCEWNYTGCPDADVSDCYISWPGVVSNPAKSAEFYLD